MKYKVQMQIEASSELDLEIKLHAIKALLDCFPEDSLKAIGTLEMRNPGGVKQMHDTIINFANQLTQNPLFKSAVKGLTPLINQQVNQLTSELRNQKLLG